MNDKHQQESVADENSIPGISEDGSALGEIRIKYSVVANIVRISTLSVPGVHTVGGGKMDGLADLFGKREGERGVRVVENEAGAYDIEVKVVLKFGVELARTGAQIQQTIREEVSKMTSKDVTRVDVIIDGVHQDEVAEESETAPWLGKEI